MHLPRPHRLAPFALLALAACEPKSSFPSLAPRPMERALGPVDQAPPETAVADDPALPDRLRPLVEAGHASQAEFDKALAAARRVVAASGPPGSDSWVGAQQAVSRVQNASAPMAKALADLDAFAIEQAKAHPLSPGDQDRIQQANAELQALADAQRGEIEALQARLKK